LCKNQHLQVGVHDHTLCAALQVMADHWRHPAVLARAAEATKFHEQDCAWLSGASVKMSSMLEDLVNRRADVMLQCGFIDGASMPFVLPTDLLRVLQEFQQHMGAAVVDMQIEHQQWLERRDAEHNHMRLEHWLHEECAEEQPCASNSTSPTHSGPDAVRKSGSPVVLACLTMLKWYQEQEAGASPVLAKVRAAHHKLAGMEQALCDRQRALDLLPASAGPQEPLIIDDVECLDLKRRLLSVQDCIMTTWVHDLQHLQRRCARPLRLDTTVALPPSATIFEAYELPPPLPTEQVLLPLSSAAFEDLQSPPPSPDALSEYTPQSAPVSPAASSHCPLASQSTETASTHSPQLEPSSSYHPSAATGASKRTSGEARLGSVPLPAVRPPKFKRSTNSKHISSRPAAAATRGVGRGGKGGKKMCRLCLHIEGVTIPIEGGHGNRKPPGCRYHVLLNTAKNNSNIAAAAAAHRQLDDLLKKGHTPSSLNILYRM
jgi:hypothetical protein